MSTICASTSRFAPVAQSSPGGDRRRSRSSTPARSASGRSSRSSDSISWRPFSIDSPASTQRRRRSRHAAGKRPPCVATPTSATCGSNASAASTSATIGTPASLSPARAESRIATTSERRYRRTPCIVFP